MHRYVTAWAVDAKMAVEFLSIEIRIVYICEEQIKEDSAATSAKDNAILEFIGLQKCSTELTVYLAFS